MAIKLRTRLFLVVGALLAASILVSAILSRQLTLVEVREFVTTHSETGNTASIQGMNREYMTSHVLLNPEMHE